MEIYNESIRDLLNFKRGPLKDDEKPTIHTDKVSLGSGRNLTEQGKVYVHPLAEEVVSSPQEVVDLLEKGNALRKVGVTDWVSAVGQREAHTGRTSALLARIRSSPS
jgi:centromeric protein E